MAGLPPVAGERTLLTPPLPPLTVVHLAVRDGDGTVEHAGHREVLEHLIRYSNLTTVYVEPGPHDRPTGFTRPPKWATAADGPAFVDQLRRHEGVVVAMLDADRDLATELVGAGVRLIRVEFRGDRLASLGGRQPPAGGRSGTSAGGLAASALPDGVSA